ncbi:MAG: glycosyltransferase family 8 protein [Clostridia bacterium]|nr:glycosyltransferase family 8 protein [Clostridia bacterium]
MNILTAINKKYMPYFATMIRSLAANNPGEHTVYIATKEVTNEDISAYVEQGLLPEHVRFVPVRFCDDILKGAPTVNRWPTEVYYRIFAKDYLPETVDRVLYLDSDIIVKGDLSELYNSDFEGNFFVATSNIHSRFFRRFILCKNGANKKCVYANTGVLLMNLELLRKEQKIEDVLSYIKRRKLFITLPDQDVISSLYGLRIKLLDNKIYNMSEREIRWYNRRNKEKIDEKWIEERVKIIHYLSRNKPWKEPYVGILKPWYDQYKK